MAVNRDEVGFRQDPIGGLQRNGIAVDDHQHLPLLEALFVVENVLVANAQSRQCADERADHRAGMIASFGLFYMGEWLFELDRQTIQTLMYLKRSVAGHMTIFFTRTRGPFWSTRPAPILFWAVVGTQAVATLIAVYGLFMPPIGWKWAAIVWGYATCDLPAAVGEADRIE